MCWRPSPRCLAQRQVIISLAREFEAFDIDSADHCLRSLQPLLDRAIDAGVVWPELLVRDLTAVIVMNMSTVHPGDPGGADRRRYLALLLDGLRACSTTLPPPLSEQPGGSSGC